MNYENARSRAIFISDMMLQATIDLRLGAMMLDNGSLYASEKYLYDAFENYTSVKPKYYRNFMNNQMAIVANEA